MSGDDTGSMNSCNNMKPTKHRKFLVPGARDVHIPDCERAHGRRHRHGHNPGQERTQKTDLRLALAPPDAASPSKFSSASAPPATATAVSRMMCAAAPSAAGTAAVLAPSAAASPAKPSCTIGCIMFSESEMRFQGQRAGIGRRDGWSKDRRVVTWSRSTSRFRVQTPTRFSSSHHDLASPSRLPPDRRAAYTIPQASLHISQL
jgi:hypothetical protein